MLLRNLTLAERMRRGAEEKASELKDALGGMEFDSDGNYNATMPSGLKVKLKRPSIIALLGGNPMNPEGHQDDEELLKMMKVTRGH
jgi:hypothetical protein